MTLISNNDYGANLTVLAKTLVRAKMQNPVDLLVAQTDLDYLKLYSSDWDSITKENRLAGHA